MTEKFEEAFAKLYCKENEIKQVFCEALMDYNSSTIKVRYRVEGEDVQCKLIGVKEALDLISKHGLKLEERLERIEGKFVLLR
jgi:hypothetical protein